MFEEIKGKIEEANSIAVIAHENPDGDAVGSVIAMYLALKNIGKDVEAIMPEAPQAFKYLKGYNDLVKESTREKYDLVICLDCATKERLADRQGYFEKAEHTVSIDHHGTNENYAEVNFVKAEEPSCTQILASIFEGLGYEITNDIGEAIITGIITDTGGFQYSSTNKRTFEIAGNLLEKGVDVTKVYKEAYDTKTKKAFELQKRAIDRLEFFADGKIAFTYITNQDDEELQYDPGDHEGIVDIGRKIEGVETSIFFREDGEFLKISLRSNYYMNVSDILVPYGGGGHFHAAGAKIANANFETLKQEIINKVIESL